MGVKAGAAGITPSTLVRARESACGRSPDRCLSKTRASTLTSRDSKRSWSARRATFMVVSVTPHGPPRTELACVTVVPMRGAIKPFLLAWFGRPRPSRELIAVVGTPTGFSFPSTTITFFSVTFGLLSVIAARVRKTPLAIGVLVVASVMLALGGLARVALGAHWPSDVILTAVVCLSWIWAASRVVLRRG